MHQASAWATSCCITLLLYRNFGMKYYIPLGQFIDLYILNSQGGDSGGFGDRASHTLA